MPECYREKLFLPDNRGIEMTTNKPAKKKRQTVCPRYSKELWRKIRNDYETGKASSVDTLYQKYMAEGKTCPSAQCIRMRATKEGWATSRKKVGAEATEAMHDKFRRLAAKIGMDDEYIVSKIKEMVDDKNDKNNGLQRLYDITGIRAPHKIARTDDAGNAVSDVIMLVPSNGFESA